VGAKRLAVAMAVCCTVLLPAPAVAAEDAAPAREHHREVAEDQTREVQRALKRLGFASVSVDGRSSKEFKNVLCSWREAVGKKPTRKQLQATEAERILRMTQLPKPRPRYVVGLNVNLQCQSAAVVSKEKGRLAFQRFFRVSTGVSGFDTTVGMHVIQRRIDGLHNSTSYPSLSGWNMYRPAYFTSWGEAFHGSPSDASVSWAPSSHGCVRMLQKDIDYLWRTGSNGVGTKVKVYGVWRG
jgi:hypothetical protein